MRKLIEDLEALVERKRLSSAQRRAAKAKRKRRKSRVFATVTTPEQEALMAKVISAVSANPDLIAKGVFEPFLSDWTLDGTYELPTYEGSEMYVEDDPERGVFFSGAGRITDEKDADEHGLRDEANEVDVHFYARIGPHRNGKDLAAELGWEIETTMVRDWRTEVKFDGQQEGEGHAKIPAAKAAKIKSASNVISILNDVDVGHYLPTAQFPDWEEIARDRREEGTL